MKVMVTGAGGFVGRELLRQLSTQEDLEVVALDATLGGVPAWPRLQRVEGDLADAAVRAAAVGQGIDALVHLAAVPGGAAEADPAASRRVNINATFDLFADVARAGCRPRIVFASTIAVFGEPLPAAGVDDATALAPRLIYGAHKAMAEIELATLTRRGAVDGLALRLPGIIARPRGPSGMKSAFMSEVFHALAAGEPLVSPVSAQATMWLMSVQQVARNLVHALFVEGGRLPANRACTLPALQVPWAGMVDAVLSRTGAAASLVSWAPDAALEAAFGAYPPLATPAADLAGFSHDGDLATLVGRALEGVAARP